MKYMTKPQKLWKMEQRVVWFVLLLALICVTSLHVGTLAQAAKNETGVQQSDMDVQVSATPYPLIGRSLMTSEGKNIGEVENVIVGYEGQVEKVLVDVVGGFLGSGEKTVALSMDSLQLSKWNEAVYQETAEELEAMEEYVWPRRYRSRRLMDRRTVYVPYDMRPYAYHRMYGPGEHHPMYGRFDWGKRMYPEGYNYGRSRGYHGWGMPGRPMQGYGYRGFDRGWGPDRDQDRQRILAEDRIQVGKLMGQTVSNAQGEEIGEIEDVVFSRDGGEVQVILGVGGFLGFNDKTISIPLEELNEQQGKLICKLCRGDIEQEPGYRGEGHGMGGSKQQ